MKIKRNQYGKGIGEKGEASFMEYYIQEQRQNFQIEMLPMLRNTMRIPVGFSLRE